MDTNFKKLSEFNKYWENLNGCQALELCEETFVFVIRITRIRVFPKQIPPKPDIDLSFTRTLEEQIASDLILMFAPCDFYESWNYLNEHGDRFKALWETKNKFGSVL